MQLIAQPDMLPLPLKSLYLPMVLPEGCASTFT
jgi:hypothetical protein